MPNTIKRNVVGNCPSCGESHWDTAKEVERHEGCRVMFCSQCQEYSARHLNGRQYPMDDPADPNSLYAITQYRLP